MSRIDTIRTEITDDPLTRNYSEMSHAEGASDMNTAYRTLIRDTLTGLEIFTNIVPSEFVALGVADQRLVEMVVGLSGGIPIGPGTNAREAITSTFGTLSDTAIALLALLPVPQTRGEELGVGRLTPGDFQLARS